MPSSSDREVDMASQSSVAPLICIVDFHHARGPEVERWIGLDGEKDPVKDNEWSILPFLALPDGSHASSEEFSYFTLHHRAPDKDLPSSLFGISCTRHIESAELLHRPSDVTRSSVQKAVVAIVDSPYLFPRIKEKLSAVTKTWFDQRDFRDFSIIEVLKRILQQFKESIVYTAKHDDRDEYFGLSLRELIHEYKYQTLVLFKCCLLQPKMLFFGTNCERLCLIQFALISLIPGLLHNLQDCADTSFNSYEETLVIPNSLRTSDRSSLLSYMGLPLQVFGKGSLFGPYTPLQQLDVLASSTSFVAGSTNSLLLHQKVMYSDVFINLDDHTISMSSVQLRAALSLSVPDRRFIDFLTKAVNDTWDERETNLKTLILKRAWANSGTENPSRPSTHGYAGSEDFIRLQFEEYLLALLSSIKYRQYVEKHGSDPKALLSEAYGDPANDFGSSWIDAWVKTENYRIFNTFTDSNLFDIVEPRHPTAGALSVEDVQRRLTQQVAELHLDERFNSGREALGKSLASGQKKVSSAFNNFWADIEVMREAQRKKADARASDATGADTEGEKTDATTSDPQLSQNQAQVQAASSRASAYLSSWGAWAAEKRKAGWNRRSSATSATESRPNVTTVSELGAEEEELQIVDLDKKYERVPQQ